MTIDSVNEVRLCALQMAIDILKDDSSGFGLLSAADKTDVFTLADKIYKYISQPS